MSQQTSSDHNIVKSVRRKVFFWFLLVAFLLGLAGWLAFIRLEEQTTQWAHERRDLQLQNLTSDLETADALYTNLVRASDHLLRDTTLAAGQPHLGPAKVTVGAETVPDLCFGERSVANHFESVDAVTAVMGGTATLFVKSGERFIRASTNVKTAAGGRAIGTQLDPSGKAIAAIRQDKTFTGVVDILGKSYFTLYEPIHNPDGATIGIWYVGYPVETLTQLGKTIANLHVLENGWVALLDARGHRLFQSANLMGAVAQEVDAILQKEAILDHLGGFPDEDVSAQRFEAWGFTLVGGIYRPDVYHLVLSIFAESFGLLACAVLLVLLASYIAARRYSTVLLRVASLAEIETLKNQADEARHAAEQASRTKSAFLANMSHELRTPMNAIIGYSEMLIEEAKDGGQEDYVPDLESIQSAGRHLLSLINDILDLSKIEAGKMDLFIESFSLPALLGEVRSTIETLSAKNGNALVFEVDPGLGTMRSDQTKVRQTLFNLLSNASKFTKNGSVTLTASILPPQAETTGGSSLVEFQVKDTGIGMTPPQLGKLFQAFTQADASTTREFGGTGLGLVITRTFATMMGGDVSVTSELGTGTTFRLVLPLLIGEPERVVPVEKMSKSASPADTVGQPTASNEGPLILVVDDDAGSRELLSRTLLKDGYQVRVASSGQEALQLAERERPAAITLDVFMPDMDGWAVLAALKANPKLEDVPVIMVTISDEQEKGLALGVADYLTKPIDRTRMSAVLARHRLQPELGKPVLIVEDDNHMRQLSAQLLQREGWAVRTATNGLTALAALEEEIPAVILLDLLMPEMDGFEFIRVVRKRSDWEQIPIIVVTSMDLSAEERAQMRGNVVNVVQKGDFKLDELLGELRTQMKRGSSIPALIEHAPL